METTRPPRPDSNTITFSFTSKKNFEICDGDTKVCKTTGVGQEIEFQDKAGKPYAWIVPPSEENDGTIRFSETEQAQPMGTWLKKPKEGGNVQCVLQRDLPHSESPRLTSDRQGNMGIHS